MIYLLQAPGHSLIRSLVTSPAGCGKVNCNCRHMASVKAFARQRRGCWSQRCAEYLQLIISSTFAVDPGRSLPMTPPWCVVAIISGLPFSTTSMHGVYV